LKYDGWIFAVSSLVQTDSEKLPTVTNKNIIAFEKAVSAMIPSKQQKVRRTIMRTTKTTILRTLTLKCTTLSMMSRQNVRVYERKEAQCYDKTYDRYHERRLHQKEPAQTKFNDATILKRHRNTHVLVLCLSNFCIFCNPVTTVRLI